MCECLLSICLFPFLPCCFSGLREYTSVSKIKNISIVTHLKFYFVNYCMANIMRPSSLRNARKSKSSKVIRNFKHDCLINYWTCTLCLLSASFSATQRRTQPWIFRGTRSKRSMVKGKSLRIRIFCMWYVVLKLSPWWSITKIDALMRTLKSCMWKISNCWYCYIE